MKSSRNRPLKNPKIHDQKCPRYLNHVNLQNPNPLADEGRNLLTKNHHNYTSSTPILYGRPGAGLLPESMIQSGVGPGAILSSQYGDLRHGGVISHGANPYGWNRALAIFERYNNLFSLGLYRGSRGMWSVSLVCVGSMVSEIYHYGSDVAGESGGASLASGGAAAAGANANPGTAQYSSYL